MRLDVPPLEPALLDAIPHGVLVAVRMPRDPEAIPPDALDRLAPEERELAEAATGWRRAELVAGRLAAARAQRMLGLRAGPVLRDPDGSPRPPRGVRVSLAHKRTVAVALAARDHGARIGVDLERAEPARPAIASRVLTPSEIEELARLPEPRRWNDTLVRFALKEALYKAIRPLVGRYVGFHEARVRPAVDGSARITLDLRDGEGPFRVEGWYRWMGEHLLATVRLRPAAGPGA